MSLRDDGAGLLRSARARDRRHSHSSGEGSMCVHNVTEQASARKAYAPELGVLILHASKLLYAIGLRIISGVLMQCAGFGRGGGIGRRASFRC